MESKRCLPLRPAVLPFLSALLLAGGPARADTFTETYYLSTGGIADSGVDGNGFRDRSPGPDLLPYTGDDEELPEGGNSGGTWTFALLDVDGDSVADHVFSTTRRGDDDAYTLSSYSEFHHGIIAEGEDWIDLHEANHLGPSGDGTLGVDSGDDFEWNDRPNWEGQSNWYWYNNRAANQRGLGGSKWYFEGRNGAVEEVQEWTKTVNLQTNADDPTTPDLNEKGNSYARGSGVLLKGLFIPVEEIPALRDGELDPLFGWYAGDMAAYVRDVLGPKLEDPALTIYLSDEGGNSCGATRSLLPPTFLLIEQGEFQVELLPGGEAQAAYWGIEPVEPGATRTAAVLRWCRILLKGDDDTWEDDGQWNPPIDLISDGSRKNLWRREKFVRERVAPHDPSSGLGTGLPDSWGGLRLGCEIAGPDLDDTPPDACWYFVRRLDDQGIPAFEDCQQDWALTIPPGSGPGSSWFEMPLDRALDARKGKVRVEASLRVQDPAAQENRIQIALTVRGEEGPAPVAWADLKDAGLARAGVSGSNLGAGGPVEGGQPITEQGSAAISSEEGVYTLVELVFDARARRLAVFADGVELISGSYEGFEGSLVDAVRLWTEAGPGDENRIHVNEIAVLQEHPAPFIRGESNCDGLLDISDPVSSLNHLFTGGEAPCCRAAADVNADGAYDISDPVSLLGFLFLGGTRPPAPFPACGVDWNTDLECAMFPPCP